MKQLRSRSIRPRRIIAQAMLFLLLGAIVNVAVAWGDVLIGVLIDKSGWSRSDRGPVDPTGFDLKWAASLQEAWERERGAWLFEGIGWSCLQIPVHHVGFSEQFSQQRFVEPPYVDCTSAGWPMRSVGGSKRGNRTTWAVRVPGQNGYVPQSLPLFPLWPGFAINTLFYAAILWLLFAAPFAFRRWRRIKRGLCPACAYPSAPGTSDLCTECGRPVTKGYGLTGQAGTT